MPDRASTIIEDARSALAEMDSAIAELRSERKSVNERIAHLMVQRKPLARIVNAAIPRNSRKVPEGGTQ
jgi:prefoldin subunit 5